MKVTFERQDGFRHILEEPEIGRLLEIVRAHRVALYFLAQAIRKYRDLDALVMGPGSSTLSIDKFITLFSVYPTGGGSVPDDALEEIAALLTALYGRHNPDHVRGAILEGLVEERLRDRYTGLLDNNVVVRTENGIAYHTSTSVDVAGWDGAVGEAHDCKTRARRFSASWIAELERELFPRRFEIGLVTADSYRPALERLKENGVVLRDAHVVSLEKLWVFTPLRRN